MTLKGTKEQHGFTIVELLIVIVVIGVLAAITIVAYNGIQTRANNTKKIAAAKQIVNLVQSYSATYGSYPLLANRCATVDNRCTNSSGAAVAGDNTSLLTELRKIGTVPDGAQPPVDNGAYGIQYIYNATSTFNEEVHPVRIEYYLEGYGTNCGLSNITSSTNTGYTSTNGYSQTAQNRTICWAMVK